MTEALLTATPSGDGWNLTLTIVGRSRPQMLGWAEGLGHGLMLANALGWLGTHWQLVGLSRIMIVESAGDATKDAAIAKVDANTPDLWRAQARTALMDVATWRERITADDVWAVLVDRDVAEPPTPAAMGPILLFGARQNWIKKTNDVRATVRHQAHREFTVWRSLIWVPGSERSSAEEQLSLLG